INTYSLQNPHNTEQGYTYTHIEQQLAKKVGTPPRELAQEISTVLDEDPGVSSAEIAGPGFLNIRLDSGAQGALVATVIDQGEAFGTGAAMAGRRVDLEGVSANPPGQIGRAACRRGA